MKEARQSLKDSQNISISWKDIKGYEGSYRVGSTGLIYSKTRWSLREGKPYQKLTGKYIKPWRDTRGYVQVYLCKNGKTKPVGVHRLVAQAFIPNPENKKTVNHLNGDLKDNRVSNLEWATQKENNQHAYKTGLMNPSKGETHYKAKLTRSKALEIRRRFNLNKKEDSAIKLATEYGVSEATIRQVLKNITWKE